MVAHVCHPDYWETEEEELPVQVGFSFKMTDLKSISRNSSVLNKLSNLGIKS